MTMKLRRTIQIVFTITLILIFTPLLNGCSLAVEGAQDDAQDKLIGVFITEDPLDQFDDDAYLKEHSRKLMRTSESVAGSFGYEAPFSATINRHNSEDISEWTVEFEGVKGHKFFAPTWTDKDGFDCRYTHFSNSICDSGVDIKDTDQGREMKLSATLYTAPKDNIKSYDYCLNQVYQTADGEIYALPGSSFDIDTEHDEGEVMSIHLDDKTEYWGDQKKLEDKTTVTVRFAVMYEPIKITLCQMDKENKVIKQEIFTPGKLPETLHTEKDTAYLLVQTEKNVPGKKPVFSRKLYEYGDYDNGTLLETYYEQDNGVIAKQYTEIVWGK